ncbi:MAG: FecR domain-containing protein [Bacteroidetes bacterium]|nr:FecR domain-containing protein [Bacteroidota bacterium]
MGKELKEYAWNLIAKKLAGEATSAELQELEDLLRNNPELYYPLQTVADLWMHNSPEDKKQAEEAFNRHLDRMETLHIDYSASEEYIFQEEKKSIFRRKSFYALPAVAATVLLVWFFSRPKPSTAQPETKPVIKTSSELIANTGSRKHLTLTDGTLVWLNAGSKINYDKNFTNGFREITLVGEAFFDVAPNPEHPFIIHTKSMDIRVLGTSFNIKSYPSDRTTEATLLKGSIEVSIHNRPKDKIILKPNEKLVISNEDTLQQISHRKDLQSASLVVIRKPTYEEHSGAMIETSWVDNKLIFQDEKFEDLAIKMERWYGVTIRFVDPKAEGLEFTGIFEKETIKQALDALKLTAEFDYTIEGNTVTIHS